VGRGEDAAIEVDGEGEAGEVMVHSWLKPNRQSYSDWLQRNPAPDLLALAKHYGGLGNVPESKMQEFEAAREEWEARRKNRHLDPPDSSSGVEAVEHEESMPGADIPPDILKKIEANMKQRGIGRRPCLKKKEEK
jgi:hypothetical protein